MKKHVAQSARSAEYTDCISPERSVSFNKYSAYDTKQSDGEASVMLELWGMWCTPVLPSLSGPLSWGQIELNSVLMLN